MAPAFRRLGRAALRLWPLVVPALAYAGWACTGEAVTLDPAWLTKPGVYELADGGLLGVGQGKAPASLRDNRAQSQALAAAERDAKERLARHLFPDVFKRSANVAVDLKYARRVSENTWGRSAFVGMAVRPGDVSATPLPDASLILGAHRVEVVPEMLAYLEDPLLQLGGGRVFARADGWLAVGVGLAPLDGEGSLAERNALKIARLAADRALTETIFGNNFSVLEQEAETALEQNGLVNFRNWSSRQTRESIEGQLRQAVEIGSWLTDDGYLAVAMAVGSPPLGLLRPGPAAGEVIPDYPDWQVDPDWEYVLLSHPRLLEGGALVYPEAGTLHAVGVGAAKLTGNPANDRINAPRSAELDARRNIVRYLTGFSSRSRTEATEELEIILAENGVESSSIIEALEKISREKANGLIRGLEKVGEWKSEDRKLLYQAHVVEVGEVFSLR